MDTLKLSIPNMKCMGCVTTIEHHLDKVGGVKKVKTNLPNRTVELDYPGDLSTKTLILNTLKGIWYPAEVID